MIMKEEYIKTVDFIEQIHHDLLALEIKTDNKIVIVDALECVDRILNKYYLNELNLANLKDVENNRLNSKQRFQVEFIVKGAIRTLNELTEQKEEYYQVLKHQIVEHECE